MHQHRYRELLSAVYSAERQLNPEHSPSWNHVTIMTLSGAVIPLDHTTDETIIGMEICTPAAGYSSLWVIDGRGRCAAYPELGLGSDAEQMLNSVYAYGLPIVCDTPEELVGRVILGE